ncbi:MAG TPA: ferrochelatase [Rhodopila sp.]|uniref:ferrochelatase n=1 Tax=Rhodopila sp. TaxID=2480087 RepID=UPI002C3FC1F3|nr:ferrochelatase [Rhodopila sp.]HVY16373.1 ferrochelatase [Rhodopila sp.]
MPAIDPARHKVAIVLFNLGGPDSPEAIAPFLLNLFRDPAILRVPPFIRPLLARRIARARLKPATDNYALLGGKSPLLDLTREQAAALEAALPEMQAKCFIAMRYWHPMTDEAVKAVKAWAPDHVLLLPLYPQFSTTTTGSSLLAWRQAAVKAGLVAPVTTLCCYPTDPGFIAATTALVRAAYDRARDTLPAKTPLRVLFSAHGLPETIVRRGDPYQWQIEQTVAAVLSAWGEPVDHAVCYQSRATPQKWIDPSTDAEIARAAKDGTAVLVVPIAFVSEHSETLVELDVEYRHLAERLGVPGYFRVPTQNADAAFIASLAGLVRRAMADGPTLCSASGGRLCGSAHGGCPFVPRRHDGRRGTVHA